MNAKLRATGVVGCSTAASLLAHEVGCMLYSHLYVRSPPTLRHLRRVDVLFASSWVSNVPVVSCDLIFSRCRYMIKCTMSIDIYRTKCRAIVAFEWSARLIVINMFSQTDLSVPFEKRSLWNEGGRRRRGIKEVMGNDKTIARWAFYNLFHYSLLTEVIKSSFAKYNFRFIIYNICI